MNIYLKAEGIGPGVIERDGMILLVAFSLDFFQYFAFFCMGFRGKVLA